MTKQAASSRPELRAADDAVVEDAIAHADPMILRGLVYQLTGDPEVAATGVKTVQIGSFDVAAAATEADVALLRRKGAEFLKAYRDSGAGTIAIGPNERLAVSLGLMLGRTLEGEDLRYHVEELALDPAVRSLHWREKPDPAGSVAGDLEEPRRERPQGLRRRGQRIGAVAPAEAYRLLIVTPDPRLWTAR